MSYMLPTHRSEDLYERINSAGDIISGKSGEIFSDNPERQQLLNPNDTGKDISSTKNKNHENAKQLKGVRLKDSSSCLKGSDNVITASTGLNSVKYKSKENTLTRRDTCGDFKVNYKNEKIYPVIKEDKSDSRAILGVSRVIRPPLKRHRTLPCTPGSFVSEDHLINSRPKYRLESSYSMQQPIAQVTDYSTSLKDASFDKTASCKTTVKHKLAHSLRPQSFSVNSEHIQLQELTIKHHHIPDISSETQYKNTFHEKIRLKHRSKSNDDCDYSDFHLIYPTANKTDHSLDSRKTVAFCAVHSSGSQTGSENHSYLDISQKTDKDRHSPQHKQYLSPDNHIPMLERSKSVQRLANQSSTETSGLGETVTSGLSSQESILSISSVAKPANTEHASPQPDLGIDLREDTRNIGTEANSTFGTAIIDSDNIINPTNESKKSNRYRHPSHIIVPCGVNIQVHHTVSSVSAENSHGAAGGRSISPSDKVTQRQMTSRFMVSSDHLSAKGYKPPLDFRSNDVKKPDNLLMFSSNIGPDFDSLFSQSKTLKVPPSAVGIQLDQINNEWNKHNRGSSIKSRSSQGSFRSRSGSTRRSKRFLAQRESRWMKWGRERRQSFIRRLEKLENPPEPEIPRATTPVKKARQEGLMFIHPDLESKYITEDDINYIKRHKEERLKTCKLIEKSKVKLHHEKHDINRLSSNELMTLSRFWEHRVFVRARYVSILLSVVTIVIYVLSICSTQWVSYPSPEGKLLSVIALKFL